MSISPIQNSAIAPHIDLPVVISGIALEGELAPPSHPSKNLKIMDLVVEQEHLNKECDLAPGNHIADTGISSEDEPHPRAEDELVQANHS